MQGQARPHLVQGGLLGVTHQLHGFAELLVRRVAHPEGARLVGAIAVHAAAHVHQHQAVVRQLFLAGDGVGQGRVLVHGHDGREGQSRSAVVAEIFFDGPGQLGFAAARLQLAFLQPAQHGVVEGEGTLQGFDLVRILDDAQLFHQAVGGLQMRAASHGTAQRAGEIEAHDLRLQAQAAAATPHELADLRGRVRAVDEDAVLVPETGRRILVAGVRAEPVPPVRADDQTSRALVELHVMQLEAGKIKTVGSVAHQQGIQTAGAHQLAQAVASGSIGRVHARFLCREGRGDGRGEGDLFGKRSPFPPHTPPILPKTFMQVCGR